jgi:metal-dependent amidase/aminoacylase/carboxypeptidase family protein
MTTSLLRPDPAILGTLMLGALSIAVAAAATPEEVNQAYSSAYSLYVDIHQHPELSGHESRTAALLAARLRGLGYSVTEHVGGTGVVAILKNDSGPTFMLRTELDALPV